MKKQETYRNKTYRVVLTGMLFALAIALSFVESWISTFFALPPGVKLGLANTVVMFTLIFISKKQALFLVVLKAGFVFLTRGGMAGLLSLAGGVFSCLLMMLLMLPKDKPSLVILSIAGALAHNAGQLVVVCFLMGLSLFVYAPILLLFGVGMGLLTAVLLNALLPALQKTGITNKNSS